MEQKLQNKKKKEIIFLEQLDVFLITKCLMILYCMNFVKINEHWKTQEQY